MVITVVTVFKKPVMYEQPSEWNLTDPENITTSHKEGDNVNITWHISLSTSSSTGLNEGWVISKEFYPVQRFKTTYSNGTWTTFTNNSIGVTTYNCTDGICSEGED
jgi:hypothetical protein